MKINILILFVLTSCAPLSSSTSKSTSPPACPEQQRMQSVFDTIQVGARSYDVMTAMGVTPIAQSTGVDLTEQYVAKDGDRVCDTFEFKYSNDSMTIKRAY